MYTTNIFGSLDLARRALVAHQTALNTIGHNLANSATEGYSRQRVELTAVPPRQGVDVNTIRRVRDRFLDASVLVEQQALGKDRAQEGLLQRLQAVFSDPSDTGLSSSIGHFFDSFQSLSVTPSDQVARLVVITEAQRLTATLHDMRSRITQLSSDVSTDIRQQVTTANSLMSDIADLHRQIIAARGGPEPSDLLDRRDQLISQLAAIVGVTPTDRPDGTVQLAMTGTGVLLVDGTDVAPLTATLDVPTDTINLTAGAAALPVAPGSGALASLVSARNSATGPLKQAASDLDTLALTIATQVNRIHAAGTGLTEHTTLTSLNAVSGAGVALDAAGLPDTPITGGFDVFVHDATGAVTASATIPVTAAVTTLTDVSTALNLVPGLTASISSGKLTIAAAAGSTFTFGNDTAQALSALGLNTFFTGTNASTIALTDLVADDSSKVAAAQADATGLVHPGDGAAALAIARLRTATTMSAGSATFTDFLATTVGRVGSQTQSAMQSLDRQQATVQVVQGMQQQVSGVSTDDELISLTQSQTAYAAAARFATTINDVIATLLAMATT